NAVKRISGDTPNIDKSKYAELPSIIMAKLCIDTNGTVTSVDVLTKVDHRTQSSLTDTLHTWKYAPFKRNNIAVPACFSVPFKVQKPATRRAARRPRRGTCPCRMRTRLRLAAAP